MMFLCQKRVMEGLGGFEIRLIPNFLFNKFYEKIIEFTPDKWIPESDMKTKDKRHYLFGGIGSVCYMHSFLI